MTGLPRVSVLLVTKNGERYLAELLECVQRQQGEFRLQEIIAVDSGSRDRTLSILETVWRSGCTNSASDLWTWTDAQPGCLTRADRLSRLSYPGCNTRQNRLAREAACSAQD